ncbi:MAG: Gfo/Idh/MocA family oxidoreductase [Clostridia bacterium]|nr:Gfo/Idh/MocA family oxidoreductase [Clostridia bacterium]
MKKNVVVIGYGGQGGWHADHCLKSDVVSLAGIYDIKQERMELAQSKGIHTYDSAQQAFDDKNVDIIVVATPNDVHKELVISALEAGKSVVCEKPVEMSVAAFDEMVDASKRSGSLFTVHQNRRWDVDFLGIKKIIDSGDIGAPLNIESRVHGSRGIPSDWRCHKQYGGGMILDWGVHLIDQMLQLNTTGVKNVYCTITNYTNDEVDDGFKLEMYFNDGMRGYVEVGTYNFIPLPRFYMQCKKGTAIITDWTKNAQVAKLKAWNEKEVLPVQTAAGITKTMAPRDEITLDTYEVERPVSDVHDFYRNLVKAIDGIEPQKIKLPEVRAVLKVMEACFKSSETGTRIEIDDK